MPLKLEGAFTALVTPMSPQGDHVDFAKLEELVNFQIDEGIDGLVPVGTTGECPTLSHEEHDKVIETVVKISAGRVPVIAGTGSNCTMEVRPYLPIALFD
jgi:4-hydroxy-tetrahydrodipicolinate synthase